MSNDKHYPTHPGAEHPPVMTCEIPLEEYESLKRENAELKAKVDELSFDKKLLESHWESEKIRCEAASRDCISLSNENAKLVSKIESLKVGHRQGIANLKSYYKAKLESAQASMYADVVDAGMENRRLKRALWLARAERAKEHLWHDVNSDGSPKKDYKGHDWVLVQLRETDGFELIPRVAEYRRHLKRWVFIDEDYDTENTHSFRFLREQCEVIGWRFIDFAYYGKKFFVQQEINKNVERKCRAKAEEYK